MSWIYRAREVAEHEVYSLCHYRRFNEFQSLFRRQDNLIGRSPVDADMSHSVIRVSYCVSEFFDQLENNSKLAFELSLDNVRDLSCHCVSFGKHLIRRSLIFIINPTRL